MRILASSWFVFVTAGLLVAQGKTADASATKPQPSEAGRVLLQQSLRFLQSAPALHVKAAATMILPPEMGDEPPPSVDVERGHQLPNRFVSRLGAPFFETTVCDGTRVLRVQDHFHLYSVAPAPKSLDAWMRPAAGHSPGEATFAALLAPTGSAGALVDARTVELLADESVGDVVCHHLVVHDDGLRCDLWLQKGDQPFVRRHRPQLAKPSAAGAAPAEPRIVFDVVWKEVSVEPARSVFAVVEPGDAEKVDDLDAAVEARIQAKLAGAAEHGRQHASIGKPAPDVDLTMLDGSVVKWSALRGKVVVLDFWATWCGPCVRALPLVAEVVAKRKDQGVVLVAVAVRDTKEDVLAFLQKKGMSSLSVALEAGDVGPKFGVEGIPHTVVVGADGVVKAVHVGFGTGDEAKLDADVLAALTAAAKAAGRKDVPGEQDKPGKVGTPKK